MKNLWQAEQSQRLDLHFHDFLNTIWAVAKLEPREKYLYSLMQSVPFRDLEVALDIAIIEYDASDEHKI